MAFMGLHALIATLLFAYGYGLSLNFTITPNETSEAMRKNVSIHCSAHELNNVDQIEMMSIAKIGQPTDLANSYTLYNETRIECFDPSIECRGRIDHATPRNSFVEITINKPKVDMSGIYQCSAIFSGDNKRSITSQQGQLTVSEIDFDYVFGSIKELKMTANKEIKLRKSIEQDIVTKHMKVGKIVDEMGAKVKRKNQLLDKKVENNNLLIKKNNLSIESLKEQNKKLISLLQNEGCPDGSWSKFRSHCYKYVKELKTWFKARDYCRSIGGRLPVIEDSETNAFIHNMTRNPVTGIWIGLNDIEKEGDYVWEGSSRPLSYTSWAYTQPYNGKDDWDVAFMYKNAARWGTWSLTGRDYVICQRKVWTIL